MIQSFQSLCSFLLFLHWAGLLLLTQKSPLPELAEAPVTCACQGYRGLQWNCDHLGKLETKNPLGMGRRFNLNSYRKSRVDAAVTSQYGLNSGSYSFSFSSSLPPHLPSSLPFSPPPTEHQTWGCQVL